MIRKYDETSRPAEFITKTLDSIKLSKQFEPAVNETKQGQKCKLRV